MFADKIMHEIACLTPAELTALAQRMVDATDPAEAQRLKADLINDFYGACSSIPTSQTPCGEAESSPEL